MLDLAQQRRGLLVRRNYGRDLLFNLMLNHELNNGLLLRRLKLVLLKLRRQLRRKERVNFATYAMRRDILILHALTVPYLTPL